VPAENREAFFQPPSDRSVLEPAGRLSVPGIVEAMEGTADLLGPGIERVSLVEAIADRNPLNQTSGGSLPSPTCGRDLTAISRLSAPVPT
jgi:hypothetical protein